MFRLSKDLAMHLVHELQPFMKQCKRKTGVALERKVLGTLLFLAHGCYQSCVGDSFNLGLSQQTMSICIEQVTSAITDHLLERWVVFPQTDRSRNQVKQRFMQEYNFPGVIGAIDCTHVAIISPPVEHPTHPGLSYYNRKGFYSINVQLICDADLNILNCNPKFPGSSHDSAIWSLSSVNRHLQQAYEEGSLNSSWLIGDSGYPLQPWLLTPIIDAPEQTPEERYTNTHISARNCIERCNGVLKQRFRCLLQHRVLHYNPVKAGKIIYACVVLHNMTIKQRLAIPEKEEVQVQENNSVLVGIEDNLAGDNWLADGRRIRNRLIMNNFINN